MHLDIETDDLDAEVARLEALAARRVAFGRRWWVMEAPTGQRFRVVRHHAWEGKIDVHAWPQRGYLSRGQSSPVRAR